MNLRYEIVCVIYSLAAKLGSEFAKEVDRIQRRVTGISAFHVDIAIYKLR